ncbi:glycine-rich cell wall structural protein-like [Gigantopelta aegis]|uniref:glycine-rich cell wall structural protein-like n=1 Tax=Gigantopelta aegis TaxID=1735272 RepID=UPI001B8874CF|nr:glycine-rich cell wall structural protein-like [Gigantopelta aegis]
MFGATGGLGGSGLGGGAGMFGQLNRINKDLDYLDLEVVELALGYGDGWRLSWNWWNLTSQAGGLMGGASGTGLFSGGAGGASKKGDRKPKNVVLEHKLVPLEGNIQQPLGGGGLGTGIGGGGLGTQTGQLGTGLGMGTGLGTGTGLGIGQPGGLGTVSASREQEWDLEEEQLEH